MKAGDIVFCHSAGIVGKAIRLGEWLRFRRGSWWNHVAILDVQRNDGDWGVIQAEARGVTDSGLLSTVAPGGSYVVVPLPEGVDAEQVLAFARSQVGRWYGFLTIASIVATIILPRFVNFMVAATWICSALGFASLWFGGWVGVFTARNMYQEVPSQLYAALVPDSALPTRSERKRLHVRP